MLELMAAKSCIVAVQVVVDASAYVGGLRGKAGDIGGPMNFLLNAAGYFQTVGSARSRLSFKFPAIGGGFEKSMEATSG